MAYTRGPYAQHYTLPSPTTTTIPNARSLNFATRRYELDDDGNFVGMDPTRQRVMLAMSWGAPSTPRFLTARDAEKRRQEINAALADLVADGSIKIKSVSVDVGAAGEGSESVAFVNLITGTADTVTRQ